MFYGNTALTEVSLAETITSIGAYAFSGCAMLSTLNMPASTTSIGSYAFQNCTGFTTFTFGAGVKSIADYAFIGCTGLTSFTFPGHVTSVGHRAFDGCSSIKSLKFESGTEKLSLGWINYNGNNGSTKNRGLFNDCPIEKVELNRELSYTSGANYGYSPFANIKSIKEVTIGEQLTQVYGYLFYGDTYLADVDLPETITSIGTSAFAGCSSLSSIKIPESITSIGSSAFQNCIGFTSFTIGTGVKSIGDYAFAGCSSLTEIAFSPSVTSLGGSVFQNCTGFTSFTVPGHVTSIGHRAFDGCSSIKSLKFESGTVALSLGWINYNGNNGSTKNRGLFNDCPIEKVELNRELSYTSGANYGYSPFANIKSIKKVTIGTGAVRLGNFLFYNIKALSLVGFSEDIKEIGNSSFYGCDSITSITLPNSLETIGASAFEGCKQLTGLIFHPALKSIGNYAFKGCVAFNNFAIEEGEETLTLGNGSSEGEKTGLFKDCPITSVFIGRNLSYSYSPLANMKTLTEARFGNPVTRVPNYIFQGDTELTSVIFNRNCELQSVGKYAFDGCANLPTPEFPTTVTVFDEGAFKGCESFTDFDLPEKLVTIGSYTFQNCTGLTKFNIPATTTSIGSYAFSGCTGVKDVVFVDGNETLALGYGASKGKSYGLFNDCPLEELYLGRTVSYEVNTKGNFGYSPFYKMESLSSVTVGPVVKELPYCIFQGTGIQELYIPSSVRTIHSSFASLCPNLKQVIILGATPPNVDTSNPLISGSAEDSKFYVFFPDKYKSTKPWSNYTDKIDACCEIYSNLTYGGDNHLIAYKTDFPIVLENMVTEATDAGTYQKPIDVTYTTNGYTLKDVLNFEYTIRKALLTITAKSCTRNYGEENPEFKFDFEGFMNGEDEKVLTNDPTATTKATLKSPVGEYEIVASGAEAKNYTFEYQNGTLAVNKAPLIVSVGDYTKKQGEAIPDFTISYDGFKNNETEKVLNTKPTATTTATESSEPGEYDIVVSGGEADNYELSYENGTLTVVMADATVITAKSYTREYGETNPAFEYTVGGASLDGEPEIVCEATATSPAGEYPIIIKKGSVTNYNDAYVNGTLTITKAPLTVSVGDYTKKQGEAIPDFTISYDGFKNNETEEVMKSIPTAMTAATETSEPGKYDIVLIGGEADNYELIYSNGTLTVSEADAIVITAKSYTRVYGDDNPTYEFTSEGASLEGIPEISCEATVTSPVGEYPIIIKKGSVTNYNDSYVYGTLTIIPDTLTVTVVDTVKEQGQENPVFEIVYEGWKNNDTEEVLIAEPVATTSATADSPEGQYAIVVSGGEAQNYVFRYKEGVLTVVTPSGIAVITNGRLFDVYTVSGRKIRHQVTSFKGLAPGVYIVEGQKVIVRQP